MNTSPQIRIWRFATAPKELKSLFHDAAEPAWLTLVPGVLRGTEVEKFLSERVPALGRAPHETSGNDVVYCGGVPRETQSTQKTVNGESNRPRSKVG